MRVDSIATCELVAPEFMRYIDKGDPQGGFAYLRRAKRGVIQAKIPEFEEWYASSFT